MKLLNIMDEWTEYLESGGKLVLYKNAVFEKAFDKVPHKLLIRKR